MDKVRDLIDTDPMDLLPENRHLLEEDFEHLGRAPSSHREYWVAEMETALAIARQRRPPDIDTEGSIKYSRRRRK